MERGLAAATLFSQLAVLCVMLPGCGSAGGGPPPPSIAISVAPKTGSLFLGEAMTLMASVTGTSNTQVSWSVNGVAGGNVTVGTISVVGVYAAPTVLPSPATVTITATSLADSTKSDSAIVTIESDVVVEIMPNSASIAAGSSLPLRAAITGSGAPDPGITWTVNGISGGNATVGMIASTGTSTASYTAPGTPPVPATVQVTATSIADSSKSAVAMVTINGNVTVSVSPAPASVGLGQRLSFSATVTGSQDTKVSWSVNGIANGDASVGLVCQAGSNPCTPPTAPTAAPIDYLAPGSAPATNPVALQATSEADPSKSGTAQITILGNIAIRISPEYSFLPANGAEQFRASVSGTTNQGVTWVVTSGVAGQGCTGLGCGSVDASGNFQAPISAPSPNAIAVIAMSQADPSQKATAIVAVTSGPTIESLAPSSVTAGAVSGFTLAVSGTNFIAGSSSGASTLLLNGAAQVTNCASTTECTFTLSPSEVSSAGVLSIEIQNPGTPALQSNPVPFIVAPLAATEATIPLDFGSPSASGEDITVVDPTTAGVTPTPISVDFIGPITGGICFAQGSPITLVRPGSGTTQANLCVFGNFLDPSLNYSFTGPIPSDLPITATTAPGQLPGTIQLTFTLSPTTLPGVRSLWITTPNHDRAVVSGMLEVR